MIGAQISEWKDTGGLPFQDVAWVLEKADYDTTEPHNDGGPLGSNQERYVVQVTIKQAHRDVIKEMTTFFLAQYEITKAVESVLYAHILTSLPPEVIIDGKGYVLRGRRKPWDYGKTLRLRWGEQNVRPCQDKWMFIFELMPDKENATICVRNSP